MAQKPFLKSIRPVNLLSFGPNTEEIELRPLNILIGPNGGGKSNFIELIGLLADLPSKEPWSTVIETGGANEWTWKGSNPRGDEPAMSLLASGQLFPRDASGDLANLEPANLVEKSDFYSIKLKSNDQGAFEVASEVFRQEKRWDDDQIVPPWLSREGWNCTIHEKNPSSSIDSRSHFSMNPGSSVLSTSGVVSEFAAKVPHIREFAEKLGDIAFYRDWSFGVDAAPRDPQPAGLDSRRLDEDMRNLAQVLKAWRDRGDQPSFHRMLDLMKAFYEPARDVDVELLGTHLRIMIKEESLVSRTPGTRLSDGTLRWLALLTVLLNPTPPPAVCLEEPELGLHPDILPTLADLLIDASTRAQLIITTHSSALVDAFSDNPEAVCVCEKVEGSTVIRRLDKERLKVWLNDYSLGHLWASGEIGGNRW
jgi:predicted ATPase